MIEDCIDQNGFRLVLEIVKDKFEVEADRLQESGSAGEAGKYRAIAAILEAVEKACEEFDIT